MHTVIIAKFVPWPPNSGDKRRTLAMVHAAKEQGRVTLLAFAGPDEDAEPLKDQGVEVVTAPRRRSVAQFVQGLWKSRSLTAARFWDSRLASLLREATADRPDVLIVEHVQLYSYTAYAQSRATVLDMHNIESSLTSRYAASQSGLKRMVLSSEARALRELERRSRTADVIAVVSDVDRDLLSRNVTHDHIIVVPNAWGDTNPLPPTASPIVSFVALLSWAPNIDAAVWFRTQVWPLVLAEVPEAELLLVGRNPTNAVRALEGPSVQVTGTVPELDPYYARTRVAIAPLRSGGGSRLKILEALAAGRPVVATTIGAEGLEDLIGRGVVIADEPVAMAMEICRLLRDEGQSQELGLRGEEAVRTDHSWQAAINPLWSALADN